MGDGWSFLWVTANSHLQLSSQQGIGGGSLSHKGPAAQGSCVQQRLCASPCREYHRAENDLMVPEMSRHRWEAACLCSTRPTADSLHPRQHEARGSNPSSTDQERCDLGEGT